MTYSEENDEDSRSHEKADYDAAVPGVLVAAEGEGDSEEGETGGDEDCAGPVDCFEAVEDGYSWEGIL